MYKASVRAMVRRGIAALNDGNPALLLARARPDVELAFPGDNSWATMHRPAERGRRRHVTHRGIDECRSFAQRFVDEGLRLEIEDILVNGPPWRTRVAVRGYDYAVGPEGDDAYNNRVVAMLELRWGRLAAWEDYEDTERVTTWDARRAEADPGG